MVDAIKCCRLTVENIDQLKELQTQYKHEIGEERPTVGDFASLQQAIAQGDILFCGAFHGDRLVACCSVALFFSTFLYQHNGAFEDFFVLPAYRHQGIAKRLVHFAVENCQAAALSVSSATCDVAMYKALGFTLPLGSLLAYQKNQEP